MVVFMDKVMIVTTVTQSHDNTGLITSNHLCQPELRLHGGFQLSSGLDPSPLEELGHERDGGSQLWSLQELVEGPALGGTEQGFKLPRCLAEGGS